MIRILLLFQVSAGSVKANYNILYTQKMLHKLLLGVTGIYVAYLSMSFISEALYNTQFLSTDPTLPPAKFTYPPVMVWLGCLLCALSGYALSAYFKEPANPISVGQQVIMGGLFATNMVTTNYALLYISYPVQVIGRNIRFLFVVIVGAFFSRIRKTNSHLKLGKHKIFIASVITIGVLLFNFAKESKKDKADQHDPAWEWLGYLMLGISVVVDAFFSDSQAYSKATFKPTANQLFACTNFFSFVFCLCFSIFVERSFVASITFIVNYPVALGYILLIGLLQVIGQISIYYIVSNFKQHIFPLIATTRKILTVILSIFVFNHYINQYQWIAIGIVFCGMFYEFYEELKHQKQKDKRGEIQNNKKDGQNQSSDFESPEKKEDKKE